MKRNVLSLLLSTLLFSPSVFGQDKGEEIHHVNPCLGPINAGQLLLEEAEKGNIKIFKFEDFAEEPAQIEVSNVVVFEDELIDYEWVDSETYYEGDLIAYKGRQYESLEDSNEGNLPDESDRWQEYTQVFNYIDNLNSFLFDETKTDTRNYLHLYYQDTRDEFNIPKYVASFEWNEAINYLNSNKFVWFNPGESGHVSGPVFFDYSNDLYLEAAKIGGVKLSNEDISYSDRISRWWKVYQNLAEGDEGEVIFTYKDDEVMWKVPVLTVIAIKPNQHPKFMLLGDAFATGMAFGKDSETDADFTNVHEMESVIIEKFPALDSLFLKQGSGKQKMPIATSGILAKDWIYFVDVLVEGAKEGHWTPYISEDLNDEMTVRDFNYRMMVNEDEAVDFAFEYDQWNKSVTYYFEDQVEYAGILYESVKENNVDHIPEQWPEYWIEVVPEDTEYFFPDDLRDVKIKSKLVFDDSGKIKSINPLAFCLEVPGSFVPSGLRKEIAWFNLDQIKSTNDETFDSIIEMIKTHDFHAEIIDYEFLKVAE